MIVSLYGLWIENDGEERGGHSLIGYFESFKEVNKKLNELQDEIPELPEGKRLVVFDHDYDEKRNVITEFNYNQKLYVR